MDVKETFKQIINTYLKSLFKEKGYKKKALNFYKQTEDLYYIINLQKSHGNSYAELNFYVNCGIFSNKIATITDYEIPIFPKEADCHWRKRIREVTPIGQARYAIHKNADIDTMGVVLKTALEEALIHIESLQTTEQLVEVLCTKGTMDFRQIFRYCVRSNDRSNAIRLIQYQHKKFGQEDRWERIRAIFTRVLEEEKKDWSFKLLQ